MEIDIKGVNLGTLRALWDLKFFLNEVTTDRGRGNEYYNPSKKFLNPFFSTCSLVLGFIVSVSSIPIPSKKEGWKRKNES